MAQCSFTVNNNPCDSNLRKLSTKEATLLKLRTHRKDISCTSFICSKHDRCFLRLYSLNQTSCSDPFNTHKKRISKGLSVITLTEAEKWANKNIDLIPGKKICISCNKKIYSFLQDDETNSSEDDQTSLWDLDYTPVEKRSLTSSMKRKKGKEKLPKERKALKIKLETSRDEILSDSSEGSEDVSIQKDDDIAYQNWKQIMNELKTKYKNSQSFSEKIKILTLSPYSVRRTMEEFGASQWLVNWSREIKKEKGVLGTLEKGNVND
ncbi:hypothetical protein Ahia01_001377400 [Argonauta hians]